ncbi:Metallo-dependent phosphatase [Coemansia reversa NRRL 1564]|uniref:Metallo-dependent phosphatase n=1 Tax=Coemansia reversa (strain ATCC 12441 / NRRL 1564) TaxID=763665 RepID=A0A2G5B447_COERN|nr:Metallo-dependent phosphatase [Coemansia reversa NRRL 1564]|eukprot:PIA13507.1 Metallo-dependent phosphatase [Coemansia reversa NRRL 1564]
MSRDAYIPLQDLDIASATAASDNSDEGSSSGISRLENGILTPRRIRAQTIEATDTPKYTPFPIANSTPRNSNSSLENILNGLEDDSTTAEDAGMLSSDNRRGRYCRRPNEPIWSRHMLLLPLLLFVSMGLAALVISTIAWARDRRERPSEYVDSSLFPFVVTPGFGQYAMRLIHTNDLHGHFLPTNASGSICDPQQQSHKLGCHGGVAYSKMIIDQLRGGEKVPNSPVLLNAGDEFEGSLFYTLFRGNLSAVLLNAFDYDAIALGNHEFDLGPDHLARYLDLVHAPALCANLDFINPLPQLQAALQPFAIIERHHLGVIGVLTPETAVSSNIGLNVNVSDPAAAVSAARTRLASMGINRIVVLSHLGFEADRELAAQVSGISLIVGGHTHSYLGNPRPDSDPHPIAPYPTWVRNADDWQTAVVQAKSFGEYVGYLDLVFNDDGSLDSKMTRGTPVPVDIVSEDSSVRGRLPSRRITSLLQPFVDRANEFSSHKVGLALDDFVKPSGKRDTKELALGNLITDAMVWGTRHAPVSFIGTGSLRGSLPKGTLTRGHLFDALPFDDSLHSATISGSVLRNMIEGMLSGTRNGKPVLSSLQCSGLRWPKPGLVEIRTHVANFDSRPLRGEIWRTLDDKELYQVVMTGFIAAGGDNLLDSLNSTTVTENFRDLVELYITRFSPLSPLLNHRKS